MNDCEASVHLHMKQTFGVVNGVLRSKNINGSSKTKVYRMEDCRSRELLISLLRNQEE